MTAAEALSVLAHDYWELNLREQPTLAHDQRDPRGRRELFRESIGDFIRRDAAFRSLLDRLGEIPASSLGASDRITHALLGRELTEHREQFALSAHLRPSLFPIGPDGSVGYAMQKTTLPTPDDAEDFLARLETVPAYFKDRTERLWAGVAAGYRLPRVLLPRLVAALEGQLTGTVDDHACFKPLAAAGGRDGSAFASARERGRRIVAESVIPAYRRWLETLRTEYSAHCRDTVGVMHEPDGEAYYALAARTFTTTRLPPAEIHAIGLAEVARIRLAMDAIATEVGFAGNLAGLRQHIATDPRFVAKSKDELRERVEVLAKRIDRRIPEFFGKLPRMSYGIESIPEALSAQLPAAYAQPNPPSGLSAGVFWVTGLPERCPSSMHVPLTLHEAWPGHLMHIALLQEMTDLPAFRRNGLYSYTAYIEGWAMYCEQLGHDFGLYGDPFARYGALDMEIWRAVRLVVDTGIHTLDWSREKAIAYMSDNVALPLPTIEAEIDRYIGWPGQALAYKIGQLKVQELRDRATRRLGARLDLRALHDRFSDAGPVTLEVLDEHVESWIAAAEAAGQP